MVVSGHELLRELQGDVQEEGGGGGFGRNAVLFMLLYGLCCFLRGEGG